MLAGLQAIKKEVVGTRIFLHTAATFKQGYFSFSYRSMVRVFFRLNGSFVFHPLLPILSHHFFQVPVTGAFEVFKITDLILGRNQGIQIGLV